MIFVYKNKLNDIPSLFESGGLSFAKSNGTESGGRFYLGTKSSGSVISEPWTNYEKTFLSPNRKE